MDKLYHAAVFGSDCIHTKYSIALSLDGVRHRSNFHILQSYAFQDMASVVLTVYLLVQH